MRDRAAMVLLTLLLGAASVGCSSEQRAARRQERQDELIRPTLPSLFEANRDTVLTIINSSASAGDTLAGGKLTVEQAAAARQTINANIARIEALPDVIKSMMKSYSETQLGSRVAMSDYHVVADNRHAKQTIGLVLYRLERLARPLEDPMSNDEQRLEARLFAADEVMRLRRMAEQVKVATGADWPTTPTLASPSVEPPPWTSDQSAEQK